MIRPKCCTTVAALSDCNRSLTRLFNSSTARKEQGWGLLRRRSGPAKNPIEEVILKQRRSSGQEQRWEEPRSAVRHQTSERSSDKFGRSRPQEDTEQELDAGVTITVHGLSPRLHSKDFHRVFPPGLSSWSDQITKVQQLRNHQTLEPKGSYVLTFPSVSSTVTYRGLLSRLHALSKLKVSSKNTLWESAVPDHLRQGCDNERLNDLERQNVVVPGTVDQIQIEREEAEGRDARWRKKVDAISETHGWSAQGRNILVLMTVYPPKLREEEVEQIISKDGEAKPVAWDVSKPVRLRSRRSGRQAEREPAEQPQQSSSISDKKKPEAELGGNFLLAFADMSEAQWFNRHWNHRLVELQGYKELHRTLIHTSIIT